MQILGNAFGVPDNTVRTYAEAEIRAGYDTPFFFPTVNDSVTIVAI